MRLILGMIMGALLAGVYGYHQSHLPVDLPAVLDQVDLPGIPGGGVMAAIPEETHLAEPGLIPEPTPELNKVQTTHEVEAVPEVQPTPEVQPAPERQVAWTSFRSERSATGFAEKLSSQLSREFQVVKEGPGRYQVVFSYFSEAERAAVLGEIEAITGFRVSRG